MENVTEEVTEVSLYDKDGNPIEEVVETPVAKVEDNVEDQKPKFQVPEKFQNKSLEEVVESYLHVEKALGQKNNEVGELRRLTDQILQDRYSPAQQQTVERNSDDTEVDFNDFVESPSRAVEKALEKNPRLKSLEEKLATQAQQDAREELIKRHSDADDVVASPEFQQWLAEKPARVARLQQAHVNNDVDEADDLLSLYKQTKRVTNEEATAERDAKAKGALKDASVERGGSGEAPKKKYKRSDLIHMKLHQPQRYESMRDEIMQAYAEGRVI
jgi:hypothetical protein